MKRMTKKLGAIVLAMAMCFSLCCTALAATGEGYEITIVNATAGNTYTAYKIFDATYDEASGGVSYTINEDSAWYETISSLMTDREQDTDVAIFKLTPITGTNSYYVTKTDGVSDEEVIAALQSVSVPTGAEAAANAVAENATLVLDVGEPGYYFVTTTTGSVVSITTASPTATIIDKNTPPKLDSKTITSGLDVDDSLHDDTSAMGDTVSFEVTANVPLYAPGDDDSPEGYMVTDYEFDDEMTIGLEISGLVEDTHYTVDSDGRYWATDDLINSWVTLKEGEITYKLTDVAYNVTLELIYPSEDENGNILFDGFILKYNTISSEDLAKLDDNEGGKNYQKASEIETTYPVNATIYIDYDAELTGDVDYDNVNHIDMFWHVTTFDTPRTPSYGGHDEDEDNVFVLELDITKIGDGDETKLLDGAVFQLTGDNLQEVVTQTTYTYTELDANGYAAAKAAGTELWFEVTSGSSISFVESNGKYYTNVDPYDLMAEDPDDPDLANYVVDEQTYADPDYPYIANTLTVTHSSGVQEAEDKTVTGTTEDGKLTFIGLTVGDYTLTEIKAPDGYNLLPDDLEFTITVEWDETTGEPTFSLVESSTSEGFSMENGVVYITVDNVSGTELPGTGGIGTTIFYIIGGVLVVGAVVVLVTRRRMTREG